MTMALRDAMCRLLLLLPLCTAPIGPSFAQTASPKPVLVEQCDLSMGDLNAREKSPLPRSMSSPKEVKALCVALMTEIEREESIKTEDDFKQGKAGVGSYTYYGKREWELGERQWPLRLREAVAFALDGGARRAREDLSTIVDHLVGGDISAINHLAPSDNKDERIRRHEIGWVLLARSSLEGDTQDQVADLERVAKLAPEGLDENVPTRSAYVPLGLDGSQKAITARLKQEQDKKNAELVENVKRKAQDQIAQSLSEYSKALRASIEAETEHAKRAALHFQAALKYSEQLKQCLRGYWTCGLFRDSALEEGEKAVREALAARSDPRESADYGAQLEKLMADALLLRAQCRVVPEEDATAAGIGTSIEEVKKAMELAFPLGDELKKVETLLQSLKQMLKQKS